MNVLLMMGKSHFQASKVKRIDRPGKKAPRSTKKVKKKLVTFADEKTIFKNVEHIHNLVVQTIDKRETIECDYNFAVILTRTIAKIQENMSSPEQHHSFVQTYMIARGIKKFGRRAKEAAMQAPLNQPQQHSTVRIKLGVLGSKCFGWMLVFWN